SSSRPTRYELRRGRHQDRLLRVAQGPQERLRCTWHSLGSDGGCGMCMVPASGRRHGRYPEPVTVPPRPSRLRPIRRPVRIEASRLGGRHMHTLLLIGLLVTSNDTMKDLAAIQGEWRSVWVERNGRKVVTEGDRPTQRLLFRGDTLCLVDGTPMWSLKL